MSKGRCLTKRGWADFRKKVKWRFSIKKFPRMLLEDDIQHLSMKGSHPQKGSYIKMR